jgi:hypothetical protein
LSLGRDIRSSRAKAAADFRQVFADAVLNLEHNPGLPSAQIVHDFRVQHLAAIQRFRPFVPWHRRRSFDKAAREYESACQIASEGGDGVFALFASETTDYDKAKRQALYDAVQQLLSHAKQT